MCAATLSDAAGKKGKAFTVVTVTASMRNASLRRQAAKNPPMSLQLIGWVVNGGDPPPEYKPATVVGTNKGFSRSPLINMLSGSREFLLVRNPPGAFMRRLLGMSTLRVCQECYDSKLKDYPAQLQRE
jgi:hypothetical protein